MNYKIKEFFNNKKVNRWVYLLYLIALFTLIFEIGFNVPEGIQPFVLVFFILVLVISALFTISKYLFSVEKLVVKALIIDVLGLTFTIYCIYKQIGVGGWYDLSWVQYAVALKMIREFVTPRINYKRSVLSPSQLFVLSFLFIILAGSLFLMLPNATYTGISYIDSLFTATSAVCVTGLTVVDIGTYFTEFGQTVIIVLIQIGGLGILTFVSYFSYFFKGGATYENQLALGDISNEGRIGGVFSTLKKILLITGFIEGVGAVFIYFNIDSTLIPAFYDRIYFSIFHSISFFCNAGFSTIPGGLINTQYVHNYPFIFILSIIIIFGSMGFPIVSNLLRYLKNVIKRRFLWFIYGRDTHQAWILSLTSRLSLVVTFILIVFGTLIIYLNEYNHALVGHDGIGKFVIAFFSAVTPRTCGGATVLYGQQYFSTNLIVILLMWIGANPGSTGGGIKTTTFGVAVLNSISLAKSKTKIEFWRREISSITVQRALSKITLSLMLIGIAIYLISIFDSQFGLLKTTFEVVSAYSTVGLTMGITPHLSDPSKLVIIATMFIGRVSVLSVLVAFFKRAKTLSYRYPSDEIMIN